MSISDLRADVKGAARLPLIGFLSKLTVAPEAEKGHNKVLAARDYLDLRAVQQGSINERTSMPIRFRCAYCNQLLGISRRKANTVVRCPTCAGQVVVPNMEMEDEESEPPAVKQMVFEHPDFDKLLTAGGEQAVLVSKKEDPGGSDSPVALPAAGNPPPRSPAPPEPEFDVEKIDLPAGAAAAREVTARSRGIFLSRAKATFLLVAAVVALALAFGAGFLVGFLLQPAAHESSSSMEKSLRLSKGTVVCLTTSVFEDAGAGAGRGFGSRMANPEQSL